MQLALLQIAGFENVPVIIYSEEEGICSDMDLHYTFNEFYEDSAGDGTLDDYALIKIAVAEMKDEFGSLYDRANLELERTN